MMTDDLVKYLRELGDRNAHEPRMYHVAANHILTLRWIVSVMFFAAVGELIMISLLMGAIP